METKSETTKGRDSVRFDTIVNAPKSQLDKVKTVSDLEPGDIFRKPKSLVKWKKLDEKPKKKGWNWTYLCTDGNLKKYIDGRTKVFLTKKAH